MEDQEQYKALLSEIIAKQSIILGPEIALLKARNVQGVTVGEDGKVTNIQGNPQQILQKLVDEYVNLSGQIVKNALSSVFTKYPLIKQVE